MKTISYGRNVKLSLTVRSPNYQKKKDLRRKIASTVQKPTSTLDLKKDYEKSKM